MGGAGPPSVAGPLLARTVDVRDRPAGTAIRHCRPNNSEDRMRRRQFVSFLGGAALAPLIASRVNADPSDGCGVPVARDDGLSVASINEDKLIERAALCRMADRLAASSEANIHAVLVARGGELGFGGCF